LRPLIDAELQNDPNGELPTQMLKMVYVIAAALNIRKGPSTDTAKAGRAPIGSILRVYKKEGAWLKISHKHDVWVYGRFTVDVRLAKVNANVLNVRSGPSTNFPVVFQLNKGQEVAVMEKRVDQDTQLDWVRVGMNDVWLSESLIDYM